MKVELSREDRTVRLAEEDFERLVRDGGVPPSALVRHTPSTGDAFAPADSLPRFRDLRSADPRLPADAPPRPSVAWATALLLGFELRTFLALAVPGIGPWLAGHCAGTGPAVLELGEVHRLLCQGLLRPDAAHLAVDVLLLALVGGRLEHALGRRNLCAVYLAGTLLGGLLCLALSPTAEVGGGTGGGCALIAAAAVFARRHGDLVPRAARRAHAWILVGCLAASLLLGAQGGGLGAPLGGLIAGAAAQALLFPEALPRRRAWNRWVRLGTLTLAAFGCALPAALGPGLVPLETCHDRGLIAARPASWVHGFSLVGDRASLSPTGQAALVADTAVQAAPVQPSDAADALLAAFEARGGAVHLRRREPTAMHGWPAEYAEVGITGFYEPMVVRALLVARGHHLHRVILENTAARDRHYAALWPRIAAGVRMEEPQSVGLARRRVELRPKSLAAQIDLARELGRAGHPIEGLQAWLRAADLAPPSPAPVAGALELMAAYRMDGRGDAAATALVDFPAEPSIRLAAADVLDSLGDRETADEVILAGWRLEPGDGALRQAMLLRGLAVPAAPGLPALSPAPTLP